MEETQTVTQAIASVPLIVRGQRNWRGSDASTICSPWDDSPVAQVPNVSPDELRDALDWAVDRTGNVARWPLPERLEVMSAWARELASHKEEIARLETREMGKPIRQTRAIIDMVVTRLGRLCDARRSMQDECFATQGGAATQRVHAFATREPFGLTAGILPFNSPVSAMVWKVAPALLMGNAAVIKLSELAPVAALTAAQLLAALPVPEGALQMVNGPGSELGPVLSEHPGVRKISMTGSTPAAIDVFRRSASSLKHLTLECGSNDPAIVLDDADLPAAAKAIATLGMSVYCGQICVAPKRCIVAQSVYQEFEKLLAAEAAEIVVGDPMDERTQLGPLVNAVAAENVERQVQESLEAGARLVYGGERRGAIMSPTILSGVLPGNPIFHEGAFGPVISLIPARDEHEAVALANDSPYALRAAIFGRDTQRATALARQLDCGGVAINGPASVDNPRINVDPRKMSGVGSEGVFASLLEFSQPKFIWINNFWPQG